MMVRNIRKAAGNSRKWIALLLIGALVLPVHGQPVAAQEKEGQSVSYIKDAGLRKAINKALNKNIEKENQSNPVEQIPEVHIPEDQTPEEEQPSVDESPAEDVMDGEPEAASREEERVQEGASEELADLEPETETNETDTAEHKEEVNSAREVNKASLAEAPAEKKALRSEEQEVTKEDLEKLTVLDAVNLQIKEITGLEYAVNLETVYLDGNEIADISPLGELEHLKNFSANGQTINMAEEQVNEASLKVSNPLKGLDAQCVTEISGEEVQAEADTIIFHNLQEGTNDRTVTFTKEYEKGTFSGEIMQKVAITLPEDGKERMRRSASPRGSAMIYEKHYRYSAIQDALVQFSWDSTAKQMHVKSGWGSIDSMSWVDISAAWAAEGDKNFSRPPDDDLSPYPYTVSFNSLLSDGHVRYREYGETKLIAGWGAKRFQLATGSLLYLGQTGGNWYWNGQKRYDDRMRIVYTEPPGTDSHAFKILADGTMRRDLNPSFLASEFNVPYLNTKFKVHENHMAVLGDDFLSTRANANKKVMMRLKDSSGNIRFEEITKEGMTYYETFKDIQGLKFVHGDKLEIIDFSSAKSTIFTYNQVGKRFEIYQHSMPFYNKHLIQLIGDGGTEKGYDLLIEDGRIKTVIARGSGSTIQSGWSGKVFLSIGVYKANGDLKKKAMIRGGDHTISDNSDVSLLEGTYLDDGDEIVLYSVKNRSWDESSKIRVLGEVNGGMSGLDQYGEKPGFNTKVFRYHKSTGKLSQVDGTIAEMDGGLKNAVETQLTRLSLRPESNGDKKAWLMGLYSVGDGSVDFGNCNILKLTGLEYAVNMTNVSVSDNPLKSETYHSLRNLHDLYELTLNNIKLGSHENARKMVDQLTNLPALRKVSANNNGITDENVDEFARLRQIQYLWLNSNSISNISKLKPLVLSGPARGIYLATQNIRRPLGRAGVSESYKNKHSVIYIDGRPVLNISDILPAGKGSYNSSTNEWVWSNLDVGSIEASYNFRESRDINYTRVFFDGKVIQPIEVFEEVSVTLNPNGGTISAESFSNPIVIEKGTAVGEKLNTDTMGLTHPHGYRFAGWYENDAGMGSSWEPEAPINANMTLYAKWEPLAGEYMIIVIYVAKDNGWDEGDKVRIIGDVEGGMPELPGTGEKPNFNTTVFRYSASANKLSQVDGTIADMDGALKSTVEEKLRGFSLKPESHGNKKAWQLGLYSNAEINFGRKNVQKLTGLEYAVNMTKVSVSNNPVKPETYCSLRNLKEMTNLNIGEIELGNQEKIMVDVLVNLPALKSVYAGYNGITNVEEFSRLRQITDLNLEANSIRDLNPLYSLNTAALRNLLVESQSITEAKAEVGEGESYGFMHPIRNLSGAPVQDVSNILPAGKGSYSAVDNQITWSNLGTSTTELSYDFDTGRRTVSGSKMDYVFSGQVKIPAKVFGTTKYKLNITAGLGGMVRYTIGSETDTVISSEQTGTTKEVYVFAGQSVTLEALGKPGYDFSDWEDGTTTASKTFDMPAKELAHHARFNKKVSVTFHPNGGAWSADGSTGNKQLYLSRGEAAGPKIDETEFELEHPSGYIFAGWYQTADGTGDVWDMEAPVNQDLTLYANWNYNNEAILLFEVPKGVDLKSDGTGEATGSGMVKVVDSLDTNLLYKNVLVKATSNIRLTNSDTEEFYDVTVWKEDGSAYTDSSQPLMQLHPKGTLLPKQESFTLKTPNLYPKKKGKYQGNMVFHFSWE